MDFLSDGLGQLENLFDDVMEIFKEIGEFRGEIGKAKKNLRKIQDAYELEKNAEPEKHTAKQGDIGQAREQAALVLSNILLGKAPPTREVIQPIGNGQSTGQVAASTSESSSGAPQPPETPSTPGPPSPPGPPSKPKGLPTKGGLPSKPSGLPTKGGGPSKPKGLPTKGGLPSKPPGPPTKGGLPIKKPGLPGKSPGAPPSGINLPHGKKPSASSSSPMMSIRQKMEQELQNLREIL